MSLFLLGIQQTIEFYVSLTSTNYEYEIRSFSFFNLRSDSVHQCAHFLGSQLISVSLWLPQGDNT